MSIYGTRLFGKVDAVPGLGHVATKCFHINFVPLVPLQGWLVTSQAGRGWRGMKIPVSYKSYGVAWGRTLSFLAMIVGPCLLLFSIMDKHPDAESIGGSAAISVVGVAAFIGLRKAKSVNQASYARACNLAKHAKLSDAAMARLAQTYGEPPVAFGFQPTMPTATAPAAIAAMPATLGEPVDVDAAPGEVPEPAVAAMASAPIRPLNESRRHG